jgi:hypothetical protein
LKRYQPTLVKKNISLLSELPNRPNPTMSKSENNPKAATAVDQDDEPDEWYGFSFRASLFPTLSDFCRDKRIFSTGCAGKWI